MQALKIIFFYALLLIINSNYCKAETEKSPLNVIQEKKVYALTTEPIDVVFVCHQKDVRSLNLAIAGIKKNGENIRKTIVVSSHKFTDAAEWFDEALYPFTKMTIALEIFVGDKTRASAYVKEPNSRIGWIYQQLLKFYAPFVIPGISSNVLIVDADTIFLRKTRFIDDHGCALFNPGIEFHQPYFEHGARLLPGFRKLFARHSGISHHMLFQRPILQDLFSVIESVHKTDPWRALCRCIDPKVLLKSTLSEYEIYFNFAFARTEQVRIRPLKWKNMKFDQRKIIKYAQQGYHYVSCHTWFDTKRKRK